MPDFHKLEATIPVAPLNLIVMDSARELGDSVDKYISQFRHELYKMPENDPAFHGYVKDSYQIKINLEDGYLTISAAKEHDSEQKKHGKVIRQERYSGAMQRSFYVGDGVKTEDVKAKFEDGVLKLSIPKRELKQLPSNTTIAIEG